MHNKNYLITFYMHLKINAIVIFFMHMFMRLYNLNILLNTRINYEYRPKSDEIQRNSMKSWIPWSKKKWILVKSGKVRQSPINSSEVQWSLEILNPIVYLFSKWLLSRNLFIFVIFTSFQDTELIFRRCALLFIANTKNL